VLRSKLVLKLENRGGKLYNTDIFIVIAVHYAVGMEALDSLKAPGSRSFSLLTRISLYKPEDKI